MGVSRRQDGDSSSDEEGIGPAVPHRSAINTVNSITQIHSANLNRHGAGQ